MNSSLSHPWRRMRDQKDRIVERVDAFSADQRTARPANGGWGAIDVVEHLVLAESGMASVLAKEPSPERPRVLGAGGRFPFWVTRFVLLSGIRYKVPVESIQPHGGIAWEELTERWAAQRARLEAWLEDVTPEVLVAPRFKHPISGWLNVRDALTFAADHIHHHRQQIRRIERSLTESERKVVSEVVTDNP